MKRKSYVYVERDDGHRQSYQAIISKWLDVEPLYGRIDMRLLGKMVRAPRLIFSTIDDNYFTFILIALVRAVCGRRTVGIFLRPAQCFTGTRFYHRWKRWVFAALRRVPAIAVLTIVPFAVRPEFASVARDWIHDPQMWDVAEREKVAPITPLAQSLEQAAAGRPILCFVGGVSAIKGIEFLKDIACVDTGLADRYLVAVMGKPDTESAGHVEELAACGAMVVDRHLSDAELESLYGVADMIWACYRPDYDQASGVLGRAFQTGKTSVVRSGSVIEQYADYVGAKVLAIDYGEAARAVEAIDSRAGAADTAANGVDVRSITAMRRQFVETIAKWQ